MPLLPITAHIAIDSDELVEKFVRASGPGGQHVNTTDSAVQLFFVVWGSPSLPDMVKHRLTDLAGTRISREGVLMLRSEGARSQQQNRAEVRDRLVALIREATFVPRKRRPTKPTKGSKTRRLDAKGNRSTIKAGRGKPRLD